MRYSIVSLIVMLFSLNTASPQAPKKNTSSDIFHSIQKLNFLGTALYIAAHPDDENTALISYFSNEIKAKTAYLSLTRGDGGQNLIGTELRELLGVLRTQELLAARGIDGGEQFFSRANDFGYSKHPEETLAIWDKELVLSDVVWVIRNLKPDIIINRFDHRTSGTTHGHHTSSAILSDEAFDLANNSTALPFPFGGAHFASLHAHKVLPALPLQVLPPAAPNDLVRHPVRLRHLREDQPVHLPVPSLQRRPVALHWAVAHH